MEEDFGRSMSVFPGTDRTAWGFRVRVRVGYQSVRGHAEQAVAIRMSTGAGVTGEVLTNHLFGQSDLTHRP